MLPAAPSSPQGGHRGPSLRLTRTFLCRWVVFQEAKGVSDDHKTRIVASVNFCCEHSRCTPLVFVVLAVAGFL